MVVGHKISGLAYWFLDSARHTRPSASLGHKGIYNSSTVTRPLQAVRITSHAWHRPLAQSGRNWPKVGSQFSHHSFLVIPFHAEPDITPSEKSANEILYTLKPRERLRPRARSNLRPLERTWGFSEVLDGLTVVLGATQEQGVGTGGLLKGKLVEGQGAAASGQNARAGGGGEPQGGDLDLGDLEQTVVVGDGADNNDRLLVVAVLQVGLDAGQGNGRAVDAGHKEAAQDNLVEGRVGTTCILRVVSKRAACMVCDGQSATV
ncbi:hypothetical protein FJTKL_03170 [Diaporthe vaccinii]|uniref:Uncharacterized protein n=1 Tax=Diaporthe vaccinii TaxID=105482 RepID=A0ABR4DVV6_9PEZI